MCVCVRARACVCVCVCVRARRYSYNTVFVLRVVWERNLRLRNVYFIYTCVRVILEPPHAGSKQLALGYTARLFCRLMCGRMCGRMCLCVRVQAKNWESAGCALFDPPSLVFRWRASYDYRIPTYIYIYIYICIYIYMYTYARTYLYA